MNGKKTKGEMIEYYLDFIATPVKQYDGVVRPPVSSPLKWSNIRSTSLSGTFMDLESYLKKNDVWIWSDQHFQHENVIRYTDRPFDNTENMNLALIENYKNTVKEGDVVIWAGDLFFGSIESFIENIMPHFNKTYNVLVVGNHDFKKKVVKAIPFDETHLLLDLNIDGERVVITHLPFGKPEDGFKNVHGHIHQYPSEETHQINVSVEMLDYAPVKIKSLL